MDGLFILFHHQHHHYQSQSSIQEYNLKSSFKLRVLKPNINYHALPQSPQHQCRQKHQSSPRLPWWYLYAWNVSIFPLTSTTFPLSLPSFSTSYPIPAKPLHPHGPSPKTYQPQSNHDSLTSLLMQFIPRSNSLSPPQRPAKQTPHHHHRRTIGQTPINTVDISATG